MTELPAGPRDSMPSIMNIRSLSSPPHPMKPEASWACLETPHNLLGCMQPTSLLWA